MAHAGRVKFFLPDKGWGRIECTGAPPSELKPEEVTSGIFVHYKDIATVDEKTLASLEEGQEVIFDVVRGEKGWQASGVRGSDGNPIRTRLHRNMLAGIFRGAVTQWNAEKAYGWISTDLSPQALGMQRVPKSVLGLNDGRVYFRWRDCGGQANREGGPEPFVQRGKAVVFQLYWDEKGLGALQVCDAVTCRPLSYGAGGADLCKRLQAVQELSGAEQLAALAGDLEKCSVCLCVARALAGSIIGRQGETVKALKAETGLDRIFVENSMSSDYRLVELRGTPANVAAGVLRIVDHLAQEPGSAQASEGAVPPPPTPPPPAELRLVVPDDGFGRVVGKGKAQLGAIEEKCTGATLTIAPKVAAGSGLVQAIIVAGEVAEARAEAVRRLVARIITCCSAVPLARHGGGPMVSGGMVGPAMGSMGAMMMLQQMASMQQGMQFPPGSGKGWGGKGSGYCGGGSGYGGGCKGCNKGASGKGCGAQHSGMGRAPPPPQALPQVAPPLAR